MHGPQTALNRSPGLSCILLKGDSEKLVNCRVAIKTSITWLLNSNSIVWKRLSGMQIESEEQASTLEHDCFVALVLRGHVTWLSGEPPCFLFKQVDLPVPQVEVLVPEVLVIHQAPLPPGVVVALLVAHPGEVQPLRVAKLVADEVEPALPTEAVHKKPDHLVQGDPSLHNC